MTTKNKIEMKRFASNGSNRGVWVNKNSGNGWHLTEWESMNCWYDDYTYIVDDGWGELRMALFDGDTVQLDWATGWETVTYLDESTRPHRYRILKKKEWYDNLSVNNSVLCWVWNGRKGIPDKPKIGRKVYKYRGDDLKLKFDCGCNCVADMYEFAEPILANECLKENK